LGNGQAAQFLLDFERWLETPAQLRIAQFPSLKPSI
jgi:hypothetical protein